MTALSGSPTPPDPAAVKTRGWFSVQILLGVAGLLTFIAIPISLNTAWDNLPWHPLLVHVPVILIPVTGVAGVILALRPNLWEKHLTWVCLVTVITLAFLNLAMSAGNSLRNDLGLYGNTTVANLVSRHAHAASILRIFLIAFTAALIIAVALYRESAGKPTGIGFIDAILRWVVTRIAGLTLIRVGFGLLALGCLYFVFLTGDLGARAVWQGRINQAHGAPPAFGNLGYPPPGP